MKIKLTLLGISTLVALAASILGYKKVRDR
mgnify:CR=1 FL=1